MNKLYSVTLQRPNGSMVQYNVIATDPLAATTGAVDKAKAKALADEGLANPVVISFTTLADRIDIE